ncbi:MAG: hypothetical protein ACE14S_11490 [Candidatus Bathyarchaeia archaeon]
MRAREGDLIETGNRVIFDVKGLVHPPDKVIAFPRYIPSAAGTRGRGSALYGKVYNLQERFRYLQQNAPQLIVQDPVFGEMLCEVPASAVTRHHQPVEKLAALRRAKKPAGLEAKAIALAETLKEAAGIPWNSIGISGSVMAGLFTAQSDIDPLVYGAENCCRVYAALQKLLKDEGSRFKPYTQEELQVLFDFRSKDTAMPFEDFVRVEQRKAFQGKYDGTDFFVRFVKDWSEFTERYGDIQYSNCGYVKIAATLADDAEALFTPCTYHIEEVEVLEGPTLQPITEVTSFRGRFCAFPTTIYGEPTTIEAQGKVELVTDTRTDKQHYRLLLGNKPTDYMIIRQPKKSLTFSSQWRTTENQKG